jgi:hypothetical protein
MTTTYNKERVDEVLSRVLMLGGVPPTKAYNAKLSSWFRTMVKRGHASPEVLRDQDGARRTFEEAYPNPSTRATYVKSWLKYIQGLTEDEFKQEYPDLDRREAVALLQSITRAALTQRKQQNLALNGPLNGP